MGGGVEDSMCGGVGGGGGMELSEWIALWSLIHRPIRTYVCTVCDKCIKLYTYVHMYVCVWR